MVGTEYGMAWEMTHGLVADCASCIADQSVRGRGTRVYAMVAGRTNKEASIEAPERGHRAEINGETKKDRRRVETGVRRRVGERRRGRLALCHKPPAREHSSGKYP